MTEDKMATCSALFLDGPLQGTTRVFDRPMPPQRLYLTVGRCDPAAPLDPPKPTQVDYVRDENPFGTEPMWVFMEADPVVEPTPEP